METAISEIVVRLAAMAVSAGALTLMLTSSARSIDRDASATSVRQEYLEALLAHHDIRFAMDGDLTGCVAPAELG
jgi:hypothetical protein